MTQAIDQRFARVSERLDGHDDDLREMRQVWSNQHIETITRLDQLGMKLGELGEKVGDVEENSKTMEVRALRQKLREAQGFGKGLRRVLWVVVGAGAATIVDRVLPLLWKLVTGGRS
jgi:hypothetical protein